MKYIWGVRRYDIRPEPVVLIPDRKYSEAEAREWHASFLQAHAHYLVNHTDDPDPPHQPELVRLPCNWEVVA